RLPFRGARAARAAATRVDHLADLRQVNRHAADRRGRVDLVPAQRRIAEVDVQRRREVLGLEHRVHRGSGRVRRLDDGGNIRRYSAAVGRRAGVLERRVLPQPGAGVADPARRCAAGDDALAVLVLPEAHRQGAGLGRPADLDRLAGRLTGLDDRGRVRVLDAVERWYVDRVRVGV